MEILRGLSRGLSLVFDIGAHWGYSTLVIIGEAEQVIAVEPSPQNLPRLRLPLLEPVSETRL
jgi:FkbM family methyltransferase